MKKILAMILALAIVVTAGISVYAYVGTAPETTEPSSQPSRSETVSKTHVEVNTEPVSEQKQEVRAVPEAVPASFSSVQDEIIYKMLNSMDYFTTAQVRFSAVFPGFDVAQDYTIETNMDTGVSHQTCSDNFMETCSADKREAYETYADGAVVREYNNLARTVRTMYAVEEKRALAEEFPDLEERYYVDENGDANYCYRGNPTNADMAGECLLPQVSAFAYLLDKDLWEVVETVEYCGRECYSIEGTVNDSYSAQIGADTFMMYVDQKTGVLLKLEAYDETGTIASSMVVSEISIDAPMTRGSFEYDMSKYEGYTELSGFTMPEPAE